MSEGLSGDAIRTVFDHGRNVKGVLTVNEGLCEVEKLVVQADGKSEIRKQQQLPFKLP